MPDTSNQSMANLSQCDAGDSQWNQEINSNTDNVVEENPTNLEWSQLPSAPVGVTLPINNGTQSEYQVPNGVNNVNGISPPSYYDVAYQRNGSFPPNNFTSQNPQRGLIHNPNGSSYLIRNALNGTGLVNGVNVWQNQTPNIGRFVQQQTWTGSQKTAGVRKQKRIRTAFTSSQMMELEQEYNRTRYLDRTRRLELAELLRLNERTIKIWFQNRRMKEKKIKTESLEESDELEMDAVSPKMGSMLIHEQYPTEAPYVAYNREGVYIDQYPVTSTPTMVASQPAPIQPQTQPVINDFSTYIEDQCHPQYQQLHFQLQHYSQQYNLNVEELSPDSTVKSENSTNASSDIVEKSWDLSWIRSINSEEDY